MVRAPFYDENGVKKGAWSAEEDEKLKSYVETHGHWNWRELPRLAGLTRCGKSCRLRWINYLRPDVKRGNYSKEEEDIILKLHQQHGNKWSLIAAKLPGRTDNEIKNYWHTRLKKLSNTEKMKKEQHNEVPNLKAIQTRNLSIRTKLNDEIPSHQIFESSPLSPWSSEISNVGLIHESASSSDMVAEDSPPMTFTFQESNEDFWAQPFVPDSSDVESEDSVFFNVGGFDLAYCNFVFDNDEDLLNQVMKELPANYQSQLYQ